jgi:hypothetical protein
MLDKTVFRVAAFGRKPPSKIPVTFAALCRDAATSARFPCTFGLRMVAADVSRLKLWETSRPGILIFAGSGWRQARRLSCDWEHLKNFNLGCSTRRVSVSLTGHFLETTTQD